MIPVSPESIFLHLPKSISLICNLLQPTIIFDQFSRTSHSPLLPYLFMDAAQYREHSDATHTTHFCKPRAELGFPVRLVCAAWLELGYLLRP